MSRNGEDQTEVLGGGDPRRQPRLGRYRLERRIGQGGMAEVFLARAEGPGGFEKQVVIKRIRPQLINNERFVEMFLREGRLLAGLDHPNIVRIFELDEQEGEYFLALEYLDGLSFREVMERHWQAGRSVPLEPVLQVFADAALGLAHAHELKEPSGAPANLVHRDVSPDNIFVTTMSVTKVLDFGIAKREGLDILTQTGELKGKIQFMAPEALKGEPLDARADLWSFGVTMYWACAGRRPFDGVTDVHTIKSILEDSPRSLRQHNPRLPATIEDIVFACLEKERGRRLKSAAVLHDALAGLLAELPRGAPTPADLCAAARALPSLDHEVIPKGPAVIPSVPWPERTLPVALRSPDSASAPSLISGRGKNAVSLLAVASRAPDADDEAPTHVDRKLQSDLPSIDKHQQQGLVASGEGAEGGGEFDSATEMLPSSNLHTTDEHRRPAQSIEHTDQGDAVHTGPRASPGVGTHASFAPPSDPVINVEREAHPGPGQPVASANAPTLPQIPINPPALAPPRQPDGIHSQHTRAEAALRGWPEAANSEIPPARSSHRVPVVAGVVTALLAVIGGLWLTGRLDQAVQHLLAATRLAPDAGAAAPADASDASLAETIDASTVLALVDASAVRPVDAGAALISVDADAGAPMSRPLDAGPAVPALRQIKLIGPSHVEWLGPTAEPLAVGRATIELARTARVIFAKDPRRGGTSRIVLDAKRTTVDYARLPRGKLMVRTRPAAEVFLGAERLGRSPLGPVALVAGRYEVRLILKKQSKVIPVDVRGGKTATITHDFR